jgi:hypothetical protein
MSVLGFDIRDYTDPQKMLEEAITPRPSFTQAPFPQASTAPRPPLTGAPAPAPQAPPVTIDQGTGAVVSGPAGINPAATEQPPAVNIPGTAGPSPVNIGGGSKNMPAAIKPMEGVTNDDRLHAMAMVLGAVGQNNFSNVLGAAQAGLMEKEQTAREYNDQLRGLVTPQYAIKDGRLSYVPAQFEVDKDGNYVPRSEAAIEADIQQHLKDNPSLDHPGGATGYREEEFIRDYYSLTEEQQRERARSMGYDGILTPFDLKQIWAKNSVGLSGALARSTKEGQQDPEIRLKNWNDATDQYATAMNGYEELEYSLQTVEEGLRMFGIDPDTLEEIPDSTSVDTGPIRGRMAAWLGIGDEDLAALENMNLDEAMKFLAGFKGPTTDFEFGKAERGAFADIFTSEKMNIGRLKQIMKRIEREQELLQKRGERGIRGIQKYGRNQEEIDDYLEVNPRPWLLVE